ncbi:MAG: AsmA family protein [Devosia sp.]|uniref:AsmA family protein n=1 Tax=Devosia sp. TaxID=1871048 RepID=UPI002625772B|nr:AsmA family protein [Devosia sp.]MDB5585402.1 AsmA family protein [Devosia sp.]
MPKLTATNPGETQVLNRIYIIIGMLAILVLAAAFIVPRFVQWSDYRERMEALASGLLGAEVVIRGDIEFSLLPQPRLSFSDVLVGPPTDPAATIGTVEADFSLLEFLRDDYNVTHLVLRQPVFDVAIDESGLFGSGITFGEGGKGSVALKQATVVDGTIRLADTRAAQNLVASDVDGELGLDSFSGPYQFQGSATINSGRYGIRVNSAAVDADGYSRLTASITAVDGGASISAEGQLEAGMAPKFDGRLSLRQKPPVGETADDIRGDLVLEAQVAASTDRIVFSSYTLQPDENRAGMRLTGAASVQLGTRRSFDAVISGGVFTLPPRDAKEDPTLLPYEFVRMLSEFPAPMIPPLPGRIGVDLAEVGLRGFALRDVRMDASTDGKVWQVEQFTAQLPGEAAMRASGVLQAQNGKPAFNGQASVTTQRLDALARLWRKPDEANRLLNVPGSLDAKVLLMGDALGLSQGTLTLNGKSHAVELRVGFGAEKRLDVVGHFDDLNPGDSAVLGALLPNIAVEPSFPVSFPSGSFSLSAKSATLLGQAGAGLAAEGQWGNSGLSFTRLSAVDFGGVGLDAALQLAGTFAEPKFSGSGRVKADKGDAPALAALYDLGAVPAAWRDFVGLSLPGEVIFDLDAVEENGGQTLTLGGTLGTAAINATAQMAGGVGQALSGQLRLNGSLESNDPAALTRQLGFGDAELFGDDGSMLVALNFSGSPSNSLTSQITASVGAQSLSYSGTLLVSNGELQGTGTLHGTALNGGGVAQLVGIDGLSLPITEVNAALDFDGIRATRLTEIVGKSGASGFSGDLSQSRTGDASVIAGTMSVDSVDIAGLAGSVMGASALVPGGGVWPDGPINTGHAPRQTRGSVAVTVPKVMVGTTTVTGTKFDLSWDETKLRLGRLSAAIGAGTVSGDLVVCCAGPLPDKSVTGRLTLAGVNLDDVVSPAVAEAVGGTLDGGVSIEGTGASIASILGVLSGEGNFTLHDLTVRQLDPKVFPTVAGLNDVLETDGDALAALIGLSLGQGQFTAPTANGAFTIAGGVARMTNLLVEGNGAKLGGDLNVRLDTLGLDGNFVMSPSGFTDPNDLVTADTALIGNRVSGTLAAPVTSLNLDNFVAAVQMRANEIEVDRLQALQAADAERQRAAAEERNKLIAAQRKAAAEAAAKAAAEVAAREAAEAEALRFQQQQTPPNPQSDPILQGPLDLGLPPASTPGQFVMPLN